MAATTILLGEVLAWAWGNAAMASGLSVRSASLLARQTEKLKSSLDPNQPIEPQTESQVFHGIFLDPGTSAVYGVFLFIGTYTLGAIRALLPRLILLTIFGSIVLDAICTTGPLLPTSEYTFARFFIIPTCFYLAVAVASLVLIFPESLSHVWLASLHDSFWTPTLELLRLQSETFQTAPSDQEAWAEINARGVQLRSQLISGVETVTGQLKLIDLDTSIGRLGPTDLKKVSAELRSTMFRAGGLHAFHSYVNDLNLRDQKQAREADEHQHGSGNETTVNRYQSIHQTVKQRELQQGHDIDTLLPVLASASTNLRSASEDTLTCITVWLQECSSHRWSALFSRRQAEQIADRQRKLNQELRKVRDALEEFRTVERVKLIKPYEKFFDSKTKKLLKHDDVFTSRSLYICFVFIDTLDAFAERMVKFLKVVIAIDAQRPQTKIWFPGRIAKAGKDRIADRDFKGTGPVAMGSAEDPASFDFFDSSSSTLHDDDVTADDIEREKGLAEAPKKRNPDAFPPKSALKKFFFKMAPFFHFVKSANGIFALRMGLVSVALWIPAVCHTSAWIYYSNKGLWGLIMAQTALAVYAGDQIASFLERFAGTVLGCLLGTAIWYMGAGSGHGSPYGIVIATTAFLAPFLFGRIAGPPARLALWIMVPVTVALVVGYSWIDGHPPTVGNPGVGITIGWKRGLLVVIGFAAAFVVMLFPHPRSSRVLVRKTLAAIVGETGNIFAGEVEAFLAEEALSRRGDDTKVEFTGDKEDAGAGKVSLKERRVRKIAKRVIAVSTRLMYIHPSLTTAKFEPQFSGTWPRDKYEELLMLQIRMLGSLALLSVSFVKLDSKWCSDLVQRAPYLNPNFLSDVFTTLHILSNSLMQGHALPAHLPKLRERLVYHEIHTGRRSMNSSLIRSMFSQPFSTAIEKTQAEETDSSSEGTSSGSAPIGGPAIVDGSSSGIELEDLTLDVLLDEQLPAHATAMVALSSLISRIDEMVDIVESLCGAATFQGFELLRQDYLDQEERSIGAGFTNAPRHQK
ncbi:hypothetical protein M413DRAFT_447369 [Hebeloma cylindrosporum]|uniref:ER transporter 6TM N-terminal domain-containing protein n=1 Tax=Hebeloma cylindrosporum TaxID=76867 RepID=A0A0C3C5X4_HEBCY|nr:hypothetical protein M413DRAFT_447369 [Hebeloma cylindrosporum h7]